MSTAAVRDSAAQGWFWENKQVEIIHKGWLDKARWKLLHLDCQVHGPRLDQTNLSGLARLLHGPRPRATARNKCGKWLVRSPSKTAPLSREKSAAKIF